MYKRILSYLGSTAILISSLISCSDDGDGVRDLASKCDITLGSYYGAGQKNIRTVLQESDRAAIMLDAGGSAQSASAAPLMPGSNRSLFLFNIKATTEPSDVVCWYPADESINLEDGDIIYTIPETQDGNWTPLMLGTDNAVINSYNGCKFELEAVTGTLYIPVARGDYSVKSITVKAKGGVMIAGETRTAISDPTACQSSSSEITVNLPEALDCRSASREVPVFCAPVTLPEGIEVTITTENGETMTSTLPDEITLTRGGRYVTGAAAESESTVLVFCGDNMVYMINADLVKDIYTEGVIWSLDVRTLASQLGLPESRCDHLDDCKIVDNGKKLLLSSSYNWCALVDIATSKVLFYSTQCPNAHSAEYIMGKYIAVACSTGSTDDYSKVQLYDINHSNEIISRSDLNSAHGVVWNSQRQELYAAGNNVLQTYTIEGMDSGAASLKLVKSASTPQGGLHDLTFIDDNTLCVAGVKAYLYNLNTGSFDEMKHFTNSTGIKSLNYNPETGEFWYTDATVPEGNESWSSQKIRHGIDRNSADTDRIIRVPDMDMYKVRVKSW
ncbi:MAG: DUF6528 family protein [Candidatus Cryptobacteroides sp.]